MAEQASWRELFNRFERAVGGPLEDVTSTSEFTKALAVGRRLRRSLEHTTQTVLGRTLNRLGAPAQKDVTELKRGLARIERRLQQLSHELEIERERPSNRRPRSKPHRRAVSTEAPQGLADAIRREVRHSALRARNGLQYLAGVNPPPVGSSPSDVIWSRDKVTLSRYRFDRPVYSPPVIVFLGLVSRSYVLDINPDNSFVGALGRAGFDVYLLDWGVPDEADAANTYETYVDFYLPRALAAAADESGTGEVMLLPYCMGSMFALLHAAAAPMTPIRAMAMLAPPVDFARLGPLVAPLRDGTIGADELIDDRGLLPGETLRGFFTVRRPTADVVQYVNLWEKLANEKALEGHAAMARWVKEQIPIPGAVFRQTVDLFILDNAFMRGEVRLGGRLLSLADVRMPILMVTAEHDDLVPNESSRPLPDLVSSQVDRLHIQSGHVSLVMGRHAHSTTVPGIVDWLAARSDRVDA